MANAIQKRIAGLPVKAKDLAKYILIGEKALIAQKAKYAAIQTAGESTTAIQAALSDTQDMAEGLLYAEARLGEIMEETPKQGKKGYGHPGGTIPTSKAFLIPVKTATTICKRHFIF